MESESNAIHAHEGATPESDTTNVTLPEKTETSTGVRRRRRVRRTRDVEDVQPSEDSTSESASSSTEPAEQQVTEAAPVATEPRKTKEQLARERRAQRLRNQGENRLGYVMGTRDTPEMTPEEIARKEAEDAARAAAANLNGNPLDGMNNMLDKFEVVRSVYRLLKKLVFVLLFLYIVKSLKGYRVKYVDGWSLAVVEKYDPSGPDATLYTSPQYLFPENIALYAVNEKGKEALITASLIKTIKRGDGSLLYIAAPVGDHTHTFSVTQREFRNHHFYGFVKVKMNPLVSFLVIQGVTSLVKFLIL